MITVIQAPPGATTERTNIAIEQVKAFYRQQPQVQTNILVRGFSFFGQGQANAIAFVRLKPWDERPGEKNSAQALVARALGALMQVKEAMVFTLNPPAIQGLGVASGFSYVLEDRSGHTLDELKAARNQILGAASKSPLLIGVRPEGAGGCAAASRHRRPHQGARARTVRREHQLDARHRLRQRVRQRFQPPGPYPARADRRRRAIPHDAAGRARPQGAQRQGRDGAVRRVHHRDVDRRPAADPALQRLSRR